MFLEDIIDRGVLFQSELLRLSLCQHSIHKCILTLHSCQGLGGIRIRHREHPFELRYTHVKKVDGESCTTAQTAEEKRRVLGQGWG
jgi:hypothetical protein